MNEISDERHSRGLTVAVPTLRRLHGVRPACLLILSGFVQADGGFVKDGSFESPTPDGAWRVEFVRSENEAATRVDFVADGRSYHGPRALHIRTVGPQNGYAILSQVITFPKPYPTVLYASGAVDADVDKYTKLYAHATVEGLDKHVHLSNGTNFKRTYGWRREHVKWTCGGRPILSVRFMVIFSGRGWAFWDDVDLTAEPKAPDPLGADTPWLTIPRIDRRPSDP